MKTRTLPPSLLVVIILATTAVGGEQSASPASAAGVHHGLTVRLDPATHMLSVTDEVSWPPGARPADVTFVLNGKLRITSADPPVEVIPEGGSTRMVGLDPQGGVPLKRYRAKTPPGMQTVTLAYEGPIDIPLSDPKEEYTRGFRETPGLVGPEGVYFSGSTIWYPRFGDELLTFRMEAEVPDGWHLISQGNGTSRGEDGKARWESGGAMDEIFLVGGPLQIFKESAGPVEALVYLHERDASLAGRYLAATAQYIDMYGSLIGPYPYGKFALVENFWETGYGMATFTLLGPQVIRFPFIISSSYPHEILHNWWGNSVYVDYATGNWCEGLTAYMADHLIQEQHGTADEYRRSTLQKYRDYVKTGRDFPLADFRNRNSAATEAVGYGKALMGFHMVRLHIGDDAFRATVSRFYREFRGKRASFRDIQRVAETASAKPLGWLFDDLTMRSGAPVLQVNASVASGASPAATARPNGHRFVIEGSLRQAQIGAPFVIDVPVVVQTERGQTTTVVRMDKASQTFSITTAAKPLALHVDPHFDVFRRLDPRETPPSIGQIFGEPAILAVLPADADATSLHAYRDLLKNWQNDTHAIDIVLDSDIVQLPADRAAWLIGRSNRVAARVFTDQPGLQLTPARVDIDGETMPFAGHTLVATVRHPANAEKAIGWIVADPVTAVPGLGRKLPHYGKYSYLGFEGEEPVNTIKGQWQPSDSPLRVDLRPAADRNATLAALPSEARKALAGR